MKNHLHLPNASPMNTGSVTAIAKPGLGGWLPLLVLLVLASITPTPVVAQEASDPEAVGGLADPYVVVDRWEVGEERIISDAPSLLRLPDGALLLAYQKIRDPQPGNMRVFRSEDDGETWQQMPERVEFGAGRLFLHEEKPYFLGVGPDLRGDIRISRSEDGGRTWAEPVTLFADHEAFYNPSTSMLKSDGKLYWTFGAPNTEGDRNTTGSRLVVVAGDLSAGLMDPGNWRISNHLTFPDPDSIAGLDPSDGSYRAHHWLEGNVVKIGDGIRVIARCRIAQHRTIHMAAVCAVKDDGRELELRFNQFHPVPGAQNQFHMFRDEESGYYWMISNLPTHPRDERRILGLSYALHPLCWFQAGILVNGPTRDYAFNYTTPLIDGEDLLFVSRSSDQHFHDNNMITFHRLKNFRSLAADLEPGE
ncbi:MAG: sialidase family protein [Verrucomicrobiales bacterium]